jgi:hypothetical protein
VLLVLDGSQISSLVTSRTTRLKAGAWRAGIERRQRRQRIATAENGADNKDPRRGRYCLLGAMIFPCVRSARMVWYNQLLRNQGSPSFNFRVSTNRQASLRQPA